MGRFITAIALCSFVAGLLPFAQAADLGPLLRCSACQPSVPYVPDESPENALVPLPQWPLPTNSPPRVLFPQNSRSLKKQRPILVENAPRDVTQSKPCSRSH